VYNSGTALKKRDNCWWNGRRHRYLKPRIFGGSIVPAGRIWRPWNVLQYLPRHAWQLGDAGCNQPLGQKVDQINVDVQAADVPPATSLRAAISNASSLTSSAKTSFSASSMLRVSMTCPLSDKLRAARNPEKNIIRASMGYNKRKFSATQRQQGG
jgi:hypothetical protein